jgi:hypothetical protein
LSLTCRHSSTWSNQTVVGILSPPMPSTLYGWPSPSALVYAYPV